MQHWAAWSFNNFLPENAGLQNSCFFYLLQESNQNFSEGHPIKKITGRSSYSFFIHPSPWKKPKKKRESFVLQTLLKHLLQESNQNFTEGHLTSHEKITGRSSYHFFNHPSPWKKVLKNRESFVLQTLLKHLLQESNQNITEGHPMKKLTGRSSDHFSITHCPGNKVFKNSREFCASNTKISLEVILWKKSLEGHLIIFSITVIALEKSI